MTITGTIKTEQDFIDAVHAKHSAPLWPVFHDMVPVYPKPRAVPTAWRYEEMRPLLIEAAKRVPAEEAERRVLMLVNANLEPPCATDTLFGGLQIVQPGETAPAHRHVAFALRFIIEGEGGFSAIEGQRIPMEPGDVILTPSWHWHDHGNEGAKPMIWMDGLDLPLFRSIPVNFAENYVESRYPSLPAPESQLRYAWKTVKSALDRNGLSYAIYHYHKKDRRHISNTIGAQAERIAAGYTAPAHRETCSFLYHIQSGSGTTIIKGADGSTAEIQWTPRYTFAVPAWSEVKHTCTSNEDAYLFALNDRPLLELLGLMKEEI